MKTPKLARHIRLAALQCNFEGGEENTLRIPELWREFGFDSEQLFHPIGELYSAVFDKEKHGGILRRYLDRSAANGVSVILYLNCHILLKSQDHMAEEWAQKEADGSYTMLYDTYHACCLNSSWMEYFKGLIEDLADYPISGIFFDGPINRPCFCSRCAAKFAGRYGKPLSEASDDEVAAFSLRTQTDAKRVFIEKLKQVNPNWIGYFNEGLMHSKASSEEMREILSLNDIIGTEGGFQFGGPPKETAIWRCGVSAKMTEAVADGKPTVIFMAGDHKPWSWYLHTPAETKLCYASILANGASVWYGIHCATSALRGAAGKAAKEMIQFEKKHSDSYQNTRSLAEVAVFRSFDTAKNYTSTGEETDLYASDSKLAGGIGNYSDSFNGAVGVLFRSNIPFDIVTELNIDDLSRYSAVLAPTAACLSGEVVAALKKYVENGGCLIADSEFGLYDEKMTRLDSPIASELAGIDVKGVSKRKPHDYFTFTKDGAGLAEAGVEFLPSPLAALDVELRGEASVLAEYCRPLAGRYAGKPEKGFAPFIVENKFGAGVVYYLAGTFFELYNTYSIVHYKKIVANLIGSGPTLAFELLDAPESVEFTVREDLDPGSILIHLVNYTGGMSRPIDSVVPLSGLRLRVPGDVESAASLVAGRELRIGNGVVELPVLNEFEVIVLSRES